MNQYRLFRLFILLNLLVLPLTIQAQQRLALVIGNSNYTHIDYLDNPVHDAEDIAKKLRQLHFDRVTLETDLSYKQMKKVIRSFSAQIHSGDIAVFYYAGHGVQSSQSENYLIPLKADIESEADLEYQAINANWVLDYLKQAKPSLKIMILDACRDNPFRSFRSWRGSNTRGLAKIRSSSGTIIAYAAAEGQKAQDGDGRNGLYTEELLKWLSKSGIEASQMFNKVSYKVNINPKSKGQSPFVAVQAAPPFCFAGCRDNPILSNIPKRKPYEPEMKNIRGGSFMMGSPSNEKGRFSDEKQHQVHVNDFWIGKTEVTFAQWDACVAGGGCQSNKHPSDEGWGRGNRPVINVSWHDANEYTRWLSQKTGKQYRLPTEAEWEYAARSGTRTAFSFGNSYKQLCQYANHADQSVDYSWRNKQCKDGVGKETAPVGRYKANKNGLKDMHGNVLEWVCSAYDEYYGGSERQCAKKNDSRSRVLRGGSWDSGPRFLRSALRFNAAAAYRLNYVGFRISRTN